MISNTKDRIDASEGVLFGTWCANLMRFILARDRETQRHTIRHHLSSTLFLSGMRLRSLRALPGAYGLLPTLGGYIEESLDQRLQGLYGDNFKKKKDLGLQLGWSFSRVTSPLRWPWTLRKAGKRGPSWLWSWTPMGVCVPREKAGREGASLLP